MSEVFDIESPFRYVYNVAVDFFKEVPRSFMNISTSSPRDKLYIYISIHPPFPATRVESIRLQLYKPFTFMGLASNAYSSSETFYFLNS
jgi:hypothetical protein